tara:strand:- start:1797 stop:3854 length:2058 start_codon:yes stop_codon:yes gene_type:complete
MVTPLFTKQSFNFDINDDGDLLVVGLPYADIASGISPNRQLQRQENGAFVTFTDRPSGDSTTGSGFISSSYFRNNLDTSTTPTSGSSFGHSVSLNGKGDRLAVIANPQIFGSGLFHVFESGSNNLGSCLYPNPWVDISISGVSGVRIPSPHSAIQLDSSGNSLITYRSKFEDYDEYVSTDKIYRYEYRYETCSNDYTWYRTSIISETENTKCKYGGLGSQAAFSGSGYRVAATYNVPSFENSSGTFHQYGDVFLVYNEAGSGTSFTGFEGEPTINCEDWVYEGDCLTRMPYSIYNSGQLCTSVTCVPGDFDPPVDDPRWPTTTSTSTTLPPDVTTTSTTSNPTTTTTTSTTENPLNPKGACCYKDDTLTNRCVYVTEQQCDYIEALPDTVGFTSWNKNVQCFDPPCIFSEGCCDWDGIATIALSGGGADIYLQPNSDISNVGWSSSDSYTKVVTDFRAPDSPAATPNIYSSTPGSTIEFGLESIESFSATTTSVSVWVYAEGSPGYISGVQLTWDDDLQDPIWRDAATITSSWHKFTWTINDSLIPGISNNAVKIINEDGYDGGDTEVYAVYAEVEYVCDGSSEECPSCFSTEEVQFTPCVGVDNCWVYNGNLSCGDNVNFKVTCDASITDVTDPNKWSLDRLDRNCADPIAPVTSGITTYDGLCDTPPLFYAVWSNTSDCDCCD